MKLWGGIVVLCVLLWSAVASAQVARVPGLDRAEWRLKVTKHVLTRINSSKGLLREGLKAANLHGSRAVVVRMVVARDGRIVSTQILRSSGLPELDAVVERLALRAAPLPALPRSYMLPTIPVILPIRFNGRSFRPEIVARSWSDGAGERFALA